MVLAGDYPTIVIENGVVATVIIGLAIIPKRPRVLCGPRGIILSITASSTPPHT
jgi:hypothetical protein